MIQLTGKTGYKRYRDYIGKTFIDGDEDLIVKDIHYLIDSAGWFWEHGQVTGKGVDISCNEKSDVGNFKRTCELVQGSDSTFYDDVDKKTRTDFQRGRKHILQDLIMPVIFDNSQCPGEKDNKSLTDIDFHIYQEGRIEKHIPKQETFLARYYYYDDDGTKHYLGTTEFHKENWKASAGSEKKKDKNKNETTYAELTHYLNISNYSKNKVKFKISPGSLESHRYYIDIDALACLIGALIECSIQDLRFNGFSSLRGESIEGSSSHVNGMIGDFSYLAKSLQPAKTQTSLSPNDNKPLLNPNYDYDRQVLFCEALYKFGYARYNRSLLTENVYELKDGIYIKKELPHSSHYAQGNVRHYHHLHIQGLKLSDIITIIKI